LDPHQACDVRLYINANDEYELPDNAIFLSVSTALLPKLSDTTFALKMIDESMTPEIRVNDVLVIDPTISPNPGDYVAVEVEGRQEVIICQYKKLSYASPEFELRTLNDNWPNIKVADGLEINIIGKVIQKISSY
jgi:SOS-response transcriptional repressor LexA